MEVFNEIVSLAEKHNEVAGWVCLKQTDHHVGAEAVRVLPKLFETLIAEVLARLEEVDEDGTVHVQALHALAPLVEKSRSATPTPVLDAVLLRLEDARFVVRIEAIRTLVKLVEKGKGGVRMIFSVLARLEDGRDDVRVQALTALAHLVEKGNATPMVLEAVLACVEDKSIPARDRVQLEAINTLVQLVEKGSATEKVTAAVLARFKDKEAWSRRSRVGALQALVHLVKIGSASSKRLFSAVLACLKEKNDDHVSVRVAVLEALAQLFEKGDAQAIGVNSRRDARLLIVAVSFFNVEVHHHGPEVRFAALQALAHLAASTDDAWVIAAVSRRFAKGMGPDDRDPKYVWDGGIYGIRGNKEVWDIWDRALDQLYPFREGMTHSHTLPEGVKL